MEKSLIATSRFIDNINTAQDFLNRINEHIDCHMHVDPEAVNYTDVEEAARLAGMLREVCETFNI